MIIFFIKFMPILLNLLTNFYKLVKTFINNLIRKLLVKYNLVFLNKK